MRDSAFPGVSSDQLSEGQFSALGFMYHNGYSPKIANDPSLVNDDPVSGRGHQGDVVLGKRDRIKGLVGVEER